MIHKKPPRLIDKFINMVKNSDMNRAIDKKGNVVRVTISFPYNVYDSPEEKASQKKISIAWIVREAVESYLYYTGL